MNKDVYQQTIINFHSDLLLQVLKSDSYPSDKDIKEKMDFFTKDFNSTVARKFLATKPALGDVMTKELYDQTIVDFHSKVFMQVLQRFPSYPDPEKVKEKMEIFVHSFNSTVAKPFLDSVPKGSLKEVVDNFPSQFLNYKDGINVIEPLTGSLLQKHIGNFENLKDTSNKSEDQVMSNMFASLTNLAKDLISLESVYPKSATDFYQKLVKTDCIKEINLNYIDVFDKNWANGLAWQIKNQSSESSPELLKMIGQESSSLFHSHNRKICEEMGDKLNMNNPSAKENKDHISMAIYKLANNFKDVNSFSPDDANKLYKEFIQSSAAMVNTQIVQVIRKSLSALLIEEVASYSSNAEHNSLAQSMTDISAEHHKFGGSLHSYYLSEKLKDFNTISNSGVNPAIIAIEKQERQEKISDYIKFIANDFANVSNGDSQASVSFFKGMLNSEHIKEVNKTLTTMFNKSLPELILKEMPATAEERSTVTANIARFLLNDLEHEDKVLNSLKKIRGQATTPIHSINKP